MSHVLTEKTGQDMMRVCGEEGGGVARARERGRASRVKEGRERMTRETERESSAC